MTMAMELRGLGAGGWGRLLPYRSYDSRSKWLQRKVLAGISESAMIAGPVSSTATSVNRGYCIWACCSEGWGLGTAAAIQVCAHGSHGTACGVALQRT
jgi:hypothetical protein